MAHIEKTIVIGKSLFDDAFNVMIKENAKTVATFVCPESAIGDVIRFNL